MTTEPLDVDAVPPDRTEVLAAERLSKALASQLAHGESPKVILAGDESGTQQTLPTTAARLLVKILSEIGKGNAVAVVPVKPELTTQEAAELLNVSRPHLIKLLERGQIPFHKVGTHRRLRLADVLAYKRKALEERKAILRELVALNQDMGLYD
jgi:excisionase family DNA binding protein